MSWTQHGFAEIAGLVEERAGLTFTPLRRPYAEAAICRAMTRAHLNDLGAYLVRLEADRDLVDRLISEAVVNETYFFRDPAQFDAIRTILGGELGARSAGVGFRAWSAGCASGEEAYSLAMIFAELGLRDRASVLATDVSAPAIETARRGVYGAWSFRAAGAMRGSPFFTRVAGGWSVSASARANVEFRVHNLTGPGEWPDGHFDLILCRNVLMYLAPRAVERVVTRLAASLRPGGWLITAAADPLLSTPLGLTPVTTPAGLLYRRGAPEMFFAPPRRWDPPAPLLTLPPLPELPVFEEIRNVVIVQPNDESDQAPHDDTPAPEPVSPDCYVLQALELLERGALAEAAVCARRALYLDRSLPLAHLALARALRLLGWHESARRSLRHVGALVAELSPEVPVGPGEAISAQDVAECVGAERALLERGARPSA